MCVHVCMGWPALLWLIPLRQGWRHQHLRHGLEWRSSLGMLKVRLWWVMQAKNIEEAGGSTDVGERGKVMRKRDEAVCHHQWTDGSEACMQHRSMLQINLWANWTMPVKACRERGMLKWKWAVVKKKTNSQNAKVTTNRTLYEMFISLVRVWKNKPSSREFVPSATITSHQFVAVLNTFPSTPLNRPGGRKMPYYYSSNHLHFSPFHAEYERYSGHKMLCLHYSRSSAGNLLLAYPMSVLHFKI